MRASMLGIGSALVVIACSDDLAWGPGWDWDAPDARGTADAPEGSDELGEAESVDASNDGGIPDAHSRTDTAFDERNADLPSEDSGGGRSDGESCDAEACIGDSTNRSIAATSHDASNVDPDSARFEASVSDASASTVNATDATDDSIHRDAGADCDDLALSFSSDHNPSGNWLFGWHDGLVFHMYPDVNEESGYPAWHTDIPGQASRGDLGLVGKNTKSTTTRTGSNGPTLLPGQVVVHPPVWSDLATSLRWAAPAEMMVEISFAVHGVVAESAPKPTTEFRVIHRNGDISESVSLNTNGVGDSVGRTVRVSVAAGEVVEFRLTNIADYSYDSTGLDLKICTIQ